MIPLILLTLSVLTQTTNAFHNLYPTYLDHDKSYYVSKLSSAPQKYINHRKQQELLSFNATQSTTEDTPSSTNSIQIETMTAGMTYLYSNNDDQAFSVNITLNANDHQVLIDTGSPYLWLYGSNCTDASCKDKDLFDSKLATPVDDDVFALVYTSGIASGSIFEDGIIIAGFETQKFNFGVADKVPDLFKDYQFSGVLGLPADASSNTGLVNAVTFLSENDDIKSSKFTICMGEYDSDSKNSGLLYLGSTMDSLHQGDVYTSTIIDEASSQWEIKIDNIFIDDFQISFDAIKINGQQTNNSRIGLLDSGTSSLILPVADANVVHSFLSDSITDGENYAILCNTTAVFDIEISGKNWTLTPDIYVGSPYPKDEDMNGYCVSNIQGLDSLADNAWILGISFMKDKYVEFDYENRSINIAERNNNIKLVNPPSEKQTSQSVTITQSTLTTVEMSSTSSTNIATTSASVSKHSNAAPQINHSFNSITCLVLVLLSMI